MENGKEPSLFRLRTRRKTTLSSYLTARQDSWGKREKLEF
jgi:hypothetical protein